MRRFLMLFMMSWCSTAYCAGPDPQKPAAQVELAQLMPEVHEYIWGTVAFVSNTSIAVGMCPMYSRPCKLALLEWKDGDLRLVASTRDFGPTLLNLHRAANGIAGVGFNRSTLLYSADLSSKQEIGPVHDISPSGTIVIRWRKHEWQLWRIDPQEELIRTGHDTVQSVSDDALVLAGEHVLRIESTDGGMIASFPVRPESKCPTRVQILGGRRLYIEDCKQTRIADFHGNELSRLRKMKGWSVHQIGFEAASADGNRFLSMNYSRKISFLRNAGEIAVAFATLGMGVADQQDNREEIRVVDTRSGSVCFDRWRSFPMGSGIAFNNVAAISPSGGFVATVEDGTLAMYQLPGVCPSHRELKMQVPK